MSRFDTIEIKAPLVPAKKSRKSFVKKRNELKNIMRNSDLLINNQLAMLTDTLNDPELPPKQRADILIQVMELNIRMYEVVNKDEIERLRSELEYSEELQEYLSEKTLSHTDEDIIDSTFVDVTDIQEYEGIDYPDLEADLLEMNAQFEQEKKDRVENALKKETEGKTDKG